MEDLEYWQPAMLPFLQIRIKWHLDVFILHTPLQTSKAEVSLYLVHSKGGVEDKGGRSGHLNE